MASSCCREFSVAGYEIDVAFAVGSGPRVRLPDAALLRAGRHVEHAHLFQGARIVSHHPAVVRANVARRRPGDKNVAVCQQQRGPVIFRARIEPDYAFGEYRLFTLIGGTDDDWAAKFSRTRS